MQIRHASGTAPVGRGIWTDTMGRAATRAAQGLLLLAFITVAVFGLIQIKLVVIPVLIALILAAALSPLVNFLRRKGLPSALATWLTFLISIVVIGGVVTGIVFAVRSEWDELVSAATGGLDELRNFALSGPLPIDQQLIDDTVAAVTDFATSTEFGAGAITGISVVAEVLTGVVLGAVVLFFFLKDGKRIWDFFLRLFHGERLAKMRRSGFRTLEVLGNYVRGTAIVALVDAVAIGIALVILQVPLALPLAVIVFVGGFIPLVGATLAGILAALVALVANGPVVALIVTAVVIAVNQLEGDLLQPIVMGKALKLHALVILLALAAGTIVGGIIGAILAVPITAVAWAILKVWFSEPDAPPAADQQVETP